MKIAILTYGHFASIMPLAKSLAERNEVCLYLVTHGHRFAESVATLEMGHLEYGIHDESATRQLLDEDIDHYLGKQLEVKLVKYPNLKVSKLNNYLISLKVARQINKEKFDLVHFNGIKFFQFIIYFFLRRKKAMWTIHDPFLHSGEQQNDTVILYKILGFLKINLALHNRHYREEFTRTYNCRPSKVHFLPYAPLDVFGIYRKEEIRMEPNTILFFGRISKYKGVDYLIEAARQAKEQIPGLKVIIAGTGLYPIDIETLKQDPLFEIHYRFIPNHELVEFIQRSSVVACPYTDATQSGVVMTAYALAKPVIATRVGGIPEVVMDGVTGLLIPPKDTAALKEAILAFFSDPANPEKYAENIREHYFRGELSWNAASRKLEEIYLEITG